MFSGFPGCLMGCCMQFSISQVFFFVPSIIWGTWDGQRLFTSIQDCMILPKSTFPTCLSAFNMIQLYNVLQDTSQKLPCVLSCFLYACCMTEASYNQENVETVLCMGMFMHDSVSWSSVTYFLGSLGLLYKIVYCGQ